MVLYEIKKRNERNSFLHGTPGAIRTRDLPLRRRTLYPAELRVHRFTNAIIALSAPPVNLNEDHIQNILIVRAADINFYVLNLPPCDEPMPGSLQQLLNLLSAQESPLSGFEPRN